MARQYYNVNTQTKLIDTHKQFNGGLKTVDTDDALQDFYLRQAENVSISEFGFLEKRYGLAEKQKLISHGGSISITSATRVQGHHRFKYGTSTDEILAVGGKLYIKEHGQTSFTRFVGPNQTGFEKITGLSYPTDTTIEQHRANADFQATRDIGMARIKNNLYIFTGPYPLIYSRHNIQTGAALSNGTVYAMPYFIPSWNEIAGLNNGVNLLLGEDYDEVYGYDDLKLLESDTTYISNDALDRILFKPRINTIQTRHAPLIPSANHTTTFEGIPAQIKLEASVNLVAHSNFYKKFSSFSHQAGYLTYQEEDFDVTKFYLESLTDPDGVDCSSAGVGARVSYDTGSGIEYYVCSIDANVDTNTSTTNQNYQIIPTTIQYRTSGELDSAWEDVPEENLVDRRIYSNADNTSDFSNKPSQIANNPDITTVGFSFQTFNTAPTTEQELDPLHIVLDGLSVGSYDFKVVWTYERQYMDTSNSGKIDILKKFTTEYANIEITPAKISITDLGLKEDGLITCNQVRERDGRLCAWGSTSMPEYVFFSHDEYYNWFPGGYSLKFDTNEDEPIKSVVPFMNVLIVQTETKTFGIKGDTPQLAADASNFGTTLYQKFDISPIYGTIAPKSVRPVRNRLYFLSREGIVELTNLAYAADDKYNVKELDRNIKNIVPRDVEAVAIQHNYQYWINFPSTGETLRYYVEKKAWVKDTYGKDDNATYSDNTYDFNGVFKYYSKDGVLSFISNVTELDTSNSPVNSVYEIVIEKTLPSDFTKPIKSTFETANLNQGYPFHPKKYLENRMDFTLQNEYNTSKDEIAFTASNPVDNVTTLSFTNKLLKGHSYQLGFAEDETIVNVQYQLDSGTPQDATYSYIGTQNEVEVNALYFDVPYQEFDAIYILIEHSTAIDFSQAVLKDNTFDHTLNFNTFSMSEESTLNLDNLTSYDEDEAKVEINLGTVFGANETWVFDESAFDDRITAVKTVKLSGRGYNYKLFVTDRTKAKWTIENLGITFKFKRARSR